MSWTNTTADSSKAREIGISWYMYFSFYEQLKFYAQLIFVCLFCCFTSQVNSYGHCGTVSSPNHTFSWASLNKQLTSNSCTYIRLKLTTTLLEWISGKEENDRRNYFMINLHESMGPGRDRTRDPRICSQTPICSQTRYRLSWAWKKFYNLMAWTKVSLDKMESLISKAMQ